MKQLKLVLIEWEDAWASTNDIPKSLIHKTVGFIYRESKTLIVLAQSYYPDKDENITNNYFGIPQGCIKRIKELKQ